MATRNYMDESIPGRSRFTNQPAQWRLDEARSEALRSGYVGVFVALAIFAMWRLDRLVVRDRKDLKNSWMVLVLGAFAMLLWTVWTCAGHLMLRAHDEIDSAPAQLPGLETPELTH